MFFTYLRRELRRRMRQAIFIALGLAVGIGLVITVTAASDGVKNGQAAVLHSLYGVGTDLTVTQPPASGASRATTFGFRQQIQAFRHGQIAAGTKININNLVNAQYGTLASSSVSKVTGLRNVHSAVGGLALSDVTVTGTVPSIKSGGGTIASNFTTNSFTVEGVDVSNTSLGALSAAGMTSGAGFTPAEAKSNDTVIDSNYARQNKLKVGDTVAVGGTSFKVIGIASVPQGGSPPDVYIPLDQDNLASQVSGSLASASSLANNLGKWLSVAVLIAAFLLASLLTMAAVSRRVREFGTLKALGWRSVRIVGQVMGESITIGIIGGAAGVALGYGGAALIDKLAPKLSATVGTASTAPSAGAAGGGVFKSLVNATHTVSVTLTAPVTVSAIVLAVLLAIAGGLIAGAFGGWRAARLRPAAALAKVE